MTWGFLVSMLKVSVKPGGGERKGEESGRWRSGSQRYGGPHGQVTYLGESWLSGKFIPLSWGAPL